MPWSRAIHSTHRSETLPLDRHVPSARHGLVLVSSRNGREPLFERILCWPTLQEPRERYHSVGLVEGDLLQYQDIPIAERPTIRARSRSSENPSGDAHSSTPRTLVWVADIVPPKRTTSASGPQDVDRLLGASPSCGCRA